MYYIVMTEYVGPNPQENLDSDVIDIRTSPARKNMSGEICVNGWCGTTNDWSCTAHGEYPSIEEAISAIEEKFGEVRECDAESESDNPDVVKAYKQGKFIPMSRRETAGWLWEAMKEDIVADTTDDQLENLGEEYEKSANEEGMTLEYIQDILEEYRQKLRDEQEEEEEDEEESKD